MVYVGRYQPPRCSYGLFAFNDLMAMGAYRAAAVAGLAISHELVNYWL